jgi:hypothetical protein
VGTIAGGTEACAASTCIGIPNTKLGHGCSLMPKAPTSASSKNSVLKSREGESMRPSKLHLVGDVMVVDVCVLLCL